MDDRPLQRKYARIERERRFLLTSLPREVDPQDFVRLRDCFVSGTHLRLRYVEDPDGRVLVVKLGQKTPDPDDPNDTRRRIMTTIYLPEDEAASLPLTGTRSVKRRYKLAEQGWTFCIDVWEEPSAAKGLVLSEVECPSDEELSRITLPKWAEREVTEDSNYSAFVLAQGD